MQTELRSDDEGGGNDGGGGDGGRSSRSGGGGEGGMDRSGEGSGVGATEEGRGDGVGVARARGEGGQPMSSNHVSNAPPSSLLSLSPARQAITALLHDFTISPGRTII